MSADHLHLVEITDQHEAELQRWREVLAPPLRSTPPCCHRPDCPDQHCPGKPDRPPHAAQLHTGNSDGSAAGYSGSHPKAPRPNADIDWPDELRYWALVAAITCVIAGVTALLAGYLISR